MSEQDDQDWLDTLAGHERADSAAAREARSLRAAVLARAAADAPEIAAESAQREAALLARAEREGLISRSLSQQTSSATRPQTGVRGQWRGLMAATVACFAVAIGWLLLPRGEWDAVRGPQDEIVRIESQNPLALKQRLVDELRAAGVQATGYEMLGRHGIDADLPQPLPSAVRQVLARHGIPQPADGVLRVEIVQAE